MATVFTEKQWCSSPVAYWKCDVDITRSGQNVTYAFTFTVRFTGTYTWFNNGLAVVLSLDGTSKGQKQIKSQTSGQIGAKSYTLSWSETVSKTSGTTSFSATLKDTNTSNNRNSQTANLEVPAAGSSMGSVTAGSTLSGPTINVTRYDSNFYDVITLTYNNRTITRNGFTSSKLSFSEAERLTIFQAQGAGSTVSWSISGNTYTSNGGTWLGSYSGSVNITTEGLCSVTMANNFNVESNTQYSVSNPCGGTWDLYARVGGWGGTNVWSRTGVTGSASNATASPNATTIYNSNSSSKDGYVYWYIVTKINGTVIGSENSRYCTYYFVQSLCGPYFNDPGLQYKITDQGTKDLMGSNGSYYAYNNNTDLGKFIINKTTLTISYSASAQTGKNASISKYKVAVTGKSEVDRGTNTTYDIPVLTTNGTVTVTAIDSRGYSVTRSFSYNLNDYWLPTFTSLSAVRNAMSASDPSADKIVKISTTISMPSYMISYIRSHTSSKDLHYEYSTNGSSYSANGTNLLSSCTVSGNTMTLTNWATTAIFDQNTQYYIRLSVDDYYTNNILSGAVVVPISAPLISRRSQKVGINKIPGSYTLDVGGTFGCSGNASVGGNLSVSSNITAGGNINRVFKHGGTGGTSGVWCKLVNITFASHYQGEFTHLKIILGHGNNGTGDQNAYIDLYMQLGWTGSLDGRFGCYALLNPCQTSFTTSNTYLKVISNSRTNYDVWLYTNASYCVPNTIVYYSNNATVTEYYNTQTSAPSGTECNIAYDGINRNTIVNSLPDMSNVAYKNQNNNFTTGQTINGELIYTTPRVYDTNANDLIRTSSKYIASGSNIPESNWCFVNTYHDGSKDGYQLGYGIISDTLYTRNRNSGTWSSWTQIAKNSQLPSYGSSGIWSYIKFANGYAVCWGTDTISTAVNNSWGSTYNSGTKTLTAFPSGLFTATPIVSYSPGSLGNGYNYAAAVCNAGTNDSQPTTSSPGKIMLFRGTSNGSSSQKYAVTIVAFGKWN